MRMTVDASKVDLMTSELRRRIFSSIYLSDNADEALDFLISNLIPIQKYYGPFSTLIPTLGGGVMSLKLNSQYNKFLTAATNLFTDADREAQGVGGDLAQSNLRWLQQHDNEIVKWVGDFFEEIEIDSPRTDKSDGVGKKNNGSIVRPLSIVMYVLLCTYFIN